MSFHFIHSLMHSFSQFICFMHSFNFIIFMNSFISFMSFISFSSFMSFIHFMSFHFVSIHFILFHVISIPSFQFHHVSSCVSIHSFQFISCISFHFSSLLFFNSPRIPISKLVPIVISYFRNFRPGACRALPGKRYTCLKLLPVTASPVEVAGYIPPYALCTSVGQQTHFDTLPGPRRLCTTGLTCARL